MKTLPFNSVDAVLDDFEYATPYRWQSSKCYEICPMCNKVMKRKETKVCSLCRNYGKERIKNLKKAIKIVKERCGLL